MRQAGCEVVGGARQLSEHALDEVLPGAEEYSAVREPYRLVDVIDRRPSCATRSEPQRSFWKADGSVRPGRPPEQLSSILSGRIGGQRGRPDALPNDTPGCLR